MKNDILTVPSSGANLGCRFWLFIKDLVILVMRKCFQFTLRPEKRAQTVQFKKNHHPFAHADHCAIARDINDKGRLKPCKKHHYHFNLMEDLNIH